MMKNRNLTETELKRMTYLLKIADQCRTDVMDDFTNMIFDKIDCDVCPMHNQCETEAVMKDGCENLPTDIESCFETVYRYILEGAG